MMVNDGIRARELRVIDNNGEQIGVQTKNDALRLAEQAGLDLVLVSPNAKPPLLELWIMVSIALSNKRKNVKLVKIKKSSISKKCV